MITITLTYLAFHNTPFRLLIFELFCQLEDLASFPNFAFMRTMKISICTSVQNEKKARQQVFGEQIRTLLKYQFSDPRILLNESFKFTLLVHSESTQRTTHAEVVCQSRGCPNNPVECHLSKGGPAVLQCFTLGIGEMGNIAWQFSVYMELNVSGIYAVEIRTI